MSDFDRLQQKLAKLGQKTAGSGGPRRLAGEDRDSLLARLVVEIDEIILPRILSVTTDGGEVIKLAVANRRLQAVLEPVPLSAALATGMAGRPLGVGEDEALETLKSALLSFLEATTALELQSERPTAATALPAESGVPVAVLAKAWSISLDKTTHVGAAVDASIVLGQFLTDHSENLTAWLRVDGEEIGGTEGDEAMIGRLSAVFGEVLDVYLQKRQMLNVSDDEPVALGMDGADAGLLLLVHNEAKALIAVPPVQIAQITAAWASALKTTNG